LLRRFTHLQLSFSSAQHPSIVQSTKLWKHLYLPLAPYRHTSVLNELLPDDDPRSTTKKDMADKPSVLFVCVHNAGRSQMAAGFLSHLTGDAVEVRSAGSAPADSINSIVVEAMREEGIDLSDKKPKILTTDAVQASDVVITMGCGDVCPIFPGKRYLDWQLDDPAGQGLNAVRPIRDEIRRRIEKLIAELQPSG
jgi:arsenate reductase